MMIPKGTKCIMLSLMADTILDPETYHIFALEQTTRDLVVGSDIYLTAKTDGYSSFFFTNLAACLDMDVQYLIKDHEHYFVFFEKEQVYWLLVIHEADMPVNSP